MQNYQSNFAKKTKISDEEMKKIEELDLGENVFMNHENAEDIDKFFKMFHVGQK